MSVLERIERYCLIGHLVSMAFGLAGILLVMPHPEFLAYLPAGQTMYAWSLAGGGVLYMVLATIAVAVYACRMLGLRNLLTFMIPAVSISLTSELMGTSTGFPFGHYSYLSGLGYKISGLVPFTIPLSWFYLGFSAYVLARAGLSVAKSGKLGWLGQIGAVVLGSLMLTSWDFVLDPAMSQAALPFWYWHTPGAFFGMPYQNFAGWFGTGVVYITVAAFLWRQQTISIDRQELGLPLVVYLGNFVFAAVLSIGAGFWIPLGLGLLTGVAPAVVCWWLAQRGGDRAIASLSLADSVSNPTPVAVTSK
ncbi:gamma-carotene 1'-hydroxylase CruF [Leptolyngbya sp. FACHB-711]|uniref:gamma-carotene 1'-hydroxylase CruF n=1 Tax=unclassified Leptolyngbya TaxID=2650499 RepID=UPI001684F468|nr:carotenoid biosynthesis protein [Leptolyngbya sp. FACHB-711]MBD1849718.1 carotenoid biosynthesis protein [Cyanobacteria bacterium FACHB-502]MBD2025443.1 carotenoid biosynthesis protein [Leptolyngbya sp. FACHB-711]